MFFWGTSSQINDGQRAFETFGKANETEEYER